MKSILINNNLSFDYPESYRPMTDAEMQELKFLGGPCDVCLTHPESHVIISIAHKNINGFAAMMLNTKDIIMKSEKAIRRANAPYNYQLRGFIKEKFGGQIADGFSYYYHAHDIDMSCTTYVVKYKKTIYYFYVYVRDSLKDQAATEWQQMTSTFNWQ
ncbi:MAG: hypothetical protein J6P61_08135 [Erysipelotrichaceae bacterium]|nr:hypothetical protein [Erysipelotrichaceae bacterium]